jgi:flagellar protein FlaF
LQALASKAYGQVTQRTASGRALEHALFEQITLGLEQAEAAGPADPALLADAVYRNLQLWSALSADILHPDNALASDTRAGILSLSEFVRRTSQQVLAGAGSLAELIEINRTIMPGLAGTAADAA